MEREGEGEREREGGDKERQTSQLHVYLNLQTLRGVQQRRYTCHSQGLQQRQHQTIKKALQQSSRSQSSHFRLSARPQMETKLDIITLN